eukprot:g17175.t2
MVSLVTIAFSLAAFGCCVLGGDSQYDDCINGTVADIGNGRCDKELNVPSCGYDGGDCCSCTCISSSDHSCLDNTFDCIFPDCDGASTTSGESTCVEGWKNDGECDFHYNLGPECDYDGGDLKPTVGSAGDFERPAPCFPGMMLPKRCSGIDGCTHLIMTAYGERVWVVDTPAQAQAFATAVYCSGGSFEVVWRGSVTVNEPIFVADGTVVAVTGADPGAVIDGNAATQLFTVINAVLSLSNVNVSNGVGMVGGAIAASGSTLRFNGTNFVGNRATQQGGGLYVANASNVSCFEVSFSDNTAEVNGGAMFVTGSLAFSGNSSLDGNRAGDDSDSGPASGGGIYLHDSTATWSGLMSFTGNKASSKGGAVYVILGVVWCGGETRYLSNIAEETGGGVYTSGSILSWDGEVEFFNNTAASPSSYSGGGVAAVSSEVSWTGRTTVNNNHVEGEGGGGGGFSMSDGSVFTWTGDTEFTDNKADLGGAGFGPTFTNITFISNSAQVGGAASMMASGSLKDISETVPPSPTTFDRCWFIDNTATATGGAIESASGHDAIVGSVFQGNTAGTSGGALRLAGTASVDNCSFSENVSDDSGGPAISNIGVILKMQNVSFRHNVFACQPGMFLGFNASGNPYAVVCDGCQTACDGCSFEEPPMVPMCMAVMQHVFSDGGTDTLEVLSIERGYWRATPSSEDILACYNVDACLGGVTGTSGYCLEGYEGPYCSICSDGYTGGPVFTCSKCSSDAGGIALAAVLAVVVLLVAVAVAVYVMSGNTGVGSKGMIERLGRYIPLQSMKVIIVVWQILTQFTSVANVTYPDVYQRLVTGLDVFNFDLSWILSAGCVFNVDFHDQLLLSTIGPIVALLFLGGTYSVAARINRGDPEIVQVIWNKHVSMVLLLTFLVYSNVSSTLFKTFACEELADGKNYLRTDYRIECDSSRHEGLQVYAGLMIVLYTVGIPSLYGVLLFRDMDVLKRDQVDREENARIRSTSDLWKPYRPSVFYYEVIECGRRVLLAGVVVFIYPNTAAQIAVTLVIAFVFVVVSEALAPYASRWDTWLSRMGHAVVFMSMYVALLLKVDVSDERADSQTVFEAVLVAAHACMILLLPLADKEGGEGESESGADAPRQGSGGGSDSESESDLDVMEARGPGQATPCVREEAPTAPGNGILGDGGSLPPSPPLGRDDFGGGDDSPTDSSSNSSSSDSSSSSPSSSSDSSRAGGGGGGGDGGSEFSPGDEGEAGGSDGDEPGDPGGDGSGGDIEELKYDPADARYPFGVQGKKLLWSASSSGPLRHGLEPGRTRRRTRDMQDTEEVPGLGETPDPEEAPLTTVIETGGAGIVEEYICDSLVQEQWEEEQERRAEEQTRRMVEM